MFRFVRCFVISECKGNNKILNTTLFLLFLFKKFAFCMSVYEKTFAYSCLEHMQRFFLSLVSPFEGDVLCLLTVQTVQTVQVSAVRESAERPVQEPAEHPVPAAG